VTVEPDLLKHLAHDDLDDLGDDEADDQQDQETSRLGKNAKNLSVAFWKLSPIFMTYRFVSADDERGVPLRVVGIPPPSR
jgi:hypothetical protein